MLDWELINVTLSKEIPKDTIFIYTFYILIEQIYVEFHERYLIQTYSLSTNTVVVHKCWNFSVFIRKED